MSHISNQWESYANWLILEPGQKERLSLPKTKEEYAQGNNVSVRTLRRWQNDPMFKALVEKKLAVKVNSEISAVSVDGTPLLLEEEEIKSSDEDEYIQIKSTLIKGALTGDPKYLDLYFKTYGKDFVAEEAAARTSDLAGLSLDELIIDSITLLGEANVMDYLRSKGYEINFSNSK